MAYDMTYMLKSTESLQSNCLHFVLISDNRCSPQFYRNIYTYNICLLSENKKIICISFINRQKRKSLERFFSPFCSQMIFFFQDNVHALTGQRYFPTKIFPYISHTKPFTFTTLSPSHSLADFHEIFTFNSRIIRAYFNIFM